MKRQQRMDRDRNELRCWLAKVDTWRHGVTFPGLKDGDRQAEDFVRRVRELVAEGCDASPNA
jgi:hypothetical protein